MKRAKLGGVLSDHRVLVRFYRRALPVAVVFIAKADDRLDVHNSRDIHLLQTGLRKSAYGAHLNGLKHFRCSRRLCWRPPYRRGPASVSMP